MRLISRAYSARKRMLAALADGDGHDRPDARVDAPISDGLCVSYETAGRMLSVSERTIRRMVADGRLRVLPVGRRRLIPVHELKGLADAA